MKEWAGVGDAYAASYASLCAGTIDALSAAFGPAEGRRLLDVGSGTGVLAARFARDGWAVTGSEPEPTMRDVAERTAPGIRFVDGALPALPFPDASFDAVTGNFVLNHVPRPRVSAREMLRVAAPGAILGATIWLASPSWFWRAVCDRAALVPATGERLAADEEFERTAAGFGDMLADGGWQNVAVDELTWTWRVSAQALWASAEGGVASAGMFYRGLDDADRSRFRSAFEELCAEGEVDGSIALPHTAAVAICYAR